MRLYRKSQSQFHTEHISHLHSHLQSFTVLQSFVWSSKWKCLMMYISRSVLSLYSIIHIQLVFPRLLNLMGPGAEAVPFWHHIFLSVLVSPHGCLFFLNYLWNCKKHAVVAMWVPKTIRYTLYSTIISGNMKRKISEKCDSPRISTYTSFIVKEWKKLTQKHQQDLKIANPLFKETFSLSPSRIIFKYQVQVSSPLKTALKYLWRCYKYRWYFKIALVCFLLTVDVSQGFVRAESRPLFFGWTWERRVGEGGLISASGKWNDWNRLHDVSVVWSDSKHRELCLDVILHNTMLGRTVPKSTRKYKKQSSVYALFLCGNTDVTDLCVRADGINYTSQLFTQKTLCCNVQAIFYRLPFFWNTLWTMWHLKLQRCQCSCDFLFTRCHAVTSHLNTEGCFITDVVTKKYRNMF